MHPLRLFGGIPIALKVVFADNILFADPYKLRESAVTLRVFEIDILGEHMIRN